MMDTRKLFLQLLTILLIGCTGQYIPQAPYYDDATMWITEDRDSLETGADVFYVVSTWEEDWTTDDDRVCHYADVWNPTHREHMAREMNKVAAYMSPGNRFYAPYYRHTTMETWLTQSEDTIRNRTRMAMNDVCKAFDHFQAHRDQTRPLIIAGFSQGGMAVVELLKHIDDKTYSQLAAAYVLGFKVTPEDTLQTSHIKAAQGADDTGVTICYNTVKDVKYVQPVIAATCMGINPVNWRTDATPALLHDSITVTLSPEYHVLIVSGYSGSEYHAYKGFINVGDIHSCEPWLYSECLQENINVRAKAWRKKQLKRVYDEDINPIQQIDQTLVKAKTEGKYVICQVGGNWCPWCLRFADFITNDTTISKVIEENFEYIHVNYNPRNSENGEKQQQAIALMKRLNNCGRFGFPVFVVLDEEGKVIHIQDSSFLEEGQGYNQEKVLRFFKSWTPKAAG